MGTGSKQDPNQSNVDNLQNVRPEASRHFRNKNKEYLKAKTENLQTNSKIKNIRDMYRSISDFKKDYQLRTNRVKYEKGDLVADSHSVLGRWMNHFSQLLNIHGFNDVWQTETHTAESLVPEPRAFEVEMAIEKPESHKSQGIDQIPAELVKVGSRTIRSEIYKLITSVWKKEKLPVEWKESIIVPTYKKGDKTDYSNYRGISLLPTTYKILCSTLLSTLILYAEEIIGDHQCGFRCNWSNTDHIFCIQQIL